LGYVAKGRFAYTTSLATGAEALYAHCTDAGKPKNLKSVSCIKVFLITKKKKKEF
jgi:hypothetical protein